MADDAISEAELDQLMNPAATETPTPTPPPEPAKPAEPEPVAPPAAATPTPEPTPAPAPANFDKGLMQEQQRRAALEKKFEAQQAELDALKVRLAQPPPAPPAPPEPDELDLLAKDVDDDAVYDSTIHGRAAIKKLLNVAKDTRKALSETQAATKAANDRAAAAEKALQDQQAATAEAARAANVWKAFQDDPETAHIKVSDAQAKWNTLATKYSPEAATAAFEEWKGSQAKPTPTPTPAPSATPAAAKPAAGAGPAIAPPSSPRVQGGGQPAKDPLEINDEFLEGLNKEISALM